MYTIFHNDAPKLTFFAISKNASTAIIEHLHTVASYQHMHLHNHGQDANLHHISMNNLDRNQTLLLADDRFCVIQHPYKRALSLWKYSLQNTPEKERHLPFTHWLFLQLNAFNYEYPTSNQLPPDKVYFYAPQWHWAQHCNIRLNKDNLDEEYQSMFRKFCTGLYSGELNNVNVSKIPEFSTAITSSSKKMIQKIWHDDFEYLGFDY